MEHPSKNFRRCADFWVGKWKYHGWIEHLRISTTAKKSTQKLIRKGKIRVFPKKFSKILRVIHAKTTRDISNLTTDLNSQQNSPGQQLKPALADHPVIHWSTDRLKPFSAGLPVKSHTTWSCDTLIESLWLRELRHSNKKILWRHYYVIIR